MDRSSTGRCDIAVRTVDRRERLRLRRGTYASSAAILVAGGAALLARAWMLDRLWFTLPLVAIVLPAFIAAVIVGWRRSMRSHGVVAAVQARTALAALLSSRGASTQPGDRLLLVCSSPPAVLKIKERIFVLADLIDMGLAVSVVVTQRGGVLGIEVSDGPIKIFAPGGGPKI